MALEFDLTVPAFLKWTLQEWGVLSTLSYKLLSGLFVVRKRFDLR